MANLYSDWPDQQDEHISLANRHTDQLILPWHATASRQASTPVEFRLAAWLGERCQLRGILGCVGFGIEELPWTSTHWRVQRDFLLRVIVRLERRQYSWPTAFTRYRLPSETLESTVVRAANQLCVWVRRWDDVKLKRSRASATTALGTSLTPVRPYPPAWTGLAWDDIPIGRCAVHGMWCPAPSNAVPNCVFCDETSP